MKLAISTDDRLYRIEENLRRFSVERLGHPWPERAEAISICGYGPSLGDTWPETDSVVMTTSGAHDFLIGKGVIPQYHVECDPREHKVFFVRNSHPDVTYLIASHCHPKMFARLRKRRVIMWHGYTDEGFEEQGALVARFGPTDALLCGGTNVGMRALVVARHLGFRRFILHGIDCSYRNGQVWAGPHSGAPHHIVKIRCGGRVFETSDVMMTATDDFFNQMAGLRGCSFDVRGDGLLAARCEIFKRDRSLALSKNWWEPVSFRLRESAQT